MSIVDLDALLPPSVTIKFKNKEIEVKPPTTADILRLGLLGQKLQDADNTSVEDLNATVDELTAQVYKCIPELENEPLSSAQLLKLTQIIGEMATPPESKELDERGISLDTGPKAK